MGTDVFLCWEEMSKPEIEAQRAYSARNSLEAGDSGYIRAAIGMRRENGFLGYILPDKYWFNRTGMPISYDFEKMLPKMKAGSQMYLESARDGSTPRFGEAYQRAVALDIATQIMLKRKGYEAVSLTRDLVSKDAEDWLKSVWRFYDLGLYMQSQGKDPSILISW